MRVETHLCLIFSDELLSNPRFILKIVIEILEKNRAVSEKQHSCFLKVLLEKTAVHSSENWSFMPNKLQFRCHTKFINRRLFLEKYLSV